MIDHDIKGKEGIPQTAKVHSQYVSTLDNISTSRAPQNACTVVRFYDQLGNNMS